MRPIKICLLAATMLVAGITTVKAQNGDEIIDKHIKAMGGTENWNKVQSMKLTGSMNAGGMEIGMTQTIVTNKGMRMDMSVMGQNCYTIVTPTEGWMYMPIQGSDKVIPLPADKVKLSQDKLNIKNGQLVDKSLISKSEYIGMDSVNSVSCYKVKVTDKDGNTQTAFFDASTYYLLRSELTMKIPGQDEEQEVGANFSNFQKQKEGIVYPMTVGTPQGDLVFKTIELNKPVDDGIFKPTTPDKK